MVKDKKIGDIVYVNGTWNTAEKCKITGFFKSCYKVHSEDNFGTFFCNPEDIYETKEEALDAYKQQSEQIKNSYKNNIKNMDELVSFCLDRMSSAGEYTDYEAMDAVRERYNELKDEMSLDYFDEYFK